MNTLDILALLKKLIPYQVEDITLARMGKNYDGGYIVPLEAIETEVCLSFGIAEDTSYEEDLLHHKKQPIYCFDPSINTLPLRDLNNSTHICLAYQAGVSKALKEDILDHRKNHQRPTHPLLIEGRHFYPFSEGVEALETSWNIITLEEIFDAYRLKGIKTGLKVDIEGCEYELFKDIPQSLFQYIEYIVLEIHSLSSLYFLKEADTLLDTLLKSFTVIHAHPNNTLPQIFIQSFHPKIDDICFADALEITFINNKYVTRKKRKLDIIHALDRPCSVLTEEHHLNYPREIAKLEKLKIDTTNAQYIIRKGENANNAPIIALKKTTNNAPSTTSQGLIDTHFIRNDSNHQLLPTQDKNALFYIKKVLLFIGHVPFGIIFNYLRQFDQRITSQKDVLDQYKATIHKHNSWIQNVQELHLFFPTLTYQNILNKHSQNFLNSPINKKLIENVETFILIHKTKNVVSLKADINIIFLAQKLNTLKKGHIICLDHNTTRANYIYTLLKTLKLESYVTMKVLALEQYEITYKKNIIKDLWYKIPKNLFKEDIKLLILSDFVDISLHATYLQLPIIKDYLANSPTILIHLLNNNHTYTHIWTQKYPEFNFLS